MAYAMVPIYTQTVNSPVSSIVFNNIPQNYTDLMVVTSLRDTVNSTTTAGTRIYFNNSSTGFSVTWLYAEGSSTFSARESNVQWSRYAFAIGGATSTANTFSNDTVYIPNYTASIFKQIIGDSVSENNASLAYSTLSAGLWRDNSAIHSIGIQSNSATWAQYSSVTLYGIKNA